MPDPIQCSVCGARNAAGVQFCESCGVELRTVAGEQEIDRLLEELVEIKPGSAPGEKETLDIDKEIVDELLDSLLVEEEGAGQFACPTCGTKLPANARTCTNCGSTFVATKLQAPAIPPPPEEQVATREVAPPRRARAPEPSPPPAPPPPVRTPASATEPTPTSIAAERTRAPVSVAVTEEEMSGVRLKSGRLIDIVVLGTILGLLGVFGLFGMWSWSAMTPLSVGAFLGVATGGFVAGFLLFQVSTSAIAQGDRLVKTGRYEDALFYYDRAIRTGSKPASAWTSKGVALKRLGKLDQALRCHNVALQLEPENEIALCNKGDIHFKLGSFDKAIESYDKAISVRPKYAIAWNNKGAALARMERFAEARDCHDQAVKIRPKYAAAWLNRGEVLARLGFSEEAERCLERARALAS